MRDSHAKAVSELNTLKLGELLEEVDERLGTQPEPEILTLTEKMGFVSQRERFNKRLAVADTSNYKVIGLNDIAFNPYLLWANAIAQNTGWKKAIISPLYPTFRVRKGYSPRFVNHLLCSGYLRSRYGGISYGSVPRKRRTAVSDFLDLTIPRQPSLTEQERIVGLLDEADELRKLRDQADRHGAQLIPALFHNMFESTDIVQKSIGMLLEDKSLILHKDGNHGSLYPRANDFGEDGVPFLSATCITEEGGIDHSEVKWLSEEKAKLLRHGWIDRNDVLLAHNATVGKVGYYDGEYDRALIGTSLTAFRVNPERIDPHFLWGALRDQYFQRQLERIMKQALRNQVPITAQRKLLLRIPPQPLQRKFAQRMLEIRGLGSEQAASRRRLDDLFQSLLHRAFNGEL